MQYKDLIGIRQAIYEHRRKFFPKNRKSYAEALEQDRKLRIETCKGENFTYNEDDIVFVACTSNTTFSKKNSDTILGDSTFYTNPKHFLKLYIIQIYNYSIYIREIFGFLADKTAITYFKMWRGFPHLCFGDLKRKMFLLNFENTAHIAPEEVFHDCNVKNQRFHLRQN